ncbi:hypothetical protein [Aliivibrio fischeri]|uniref:hypothetical protein n=1 Tax=Aliivibrio fischeri TaxID=668 RepID=UPI00354DB898
MNLEQVLYHFKTKIIQLCSYFEFSSNLLDRIRLNKRSSRVNPDKSNMSNEILNLIKSLNIQAHPMFGTLLSIYRDKSFIYADDYDFALFGGEQLNKEFINKLSEKGAILTAYSVVNDEKLVELSFIYKDVRIDFFSLSEVNLEIVHECPNFRKERPLLEFGDVRIRNYNSYFVVSYPKFDLVLDEKWGVYLPDKCEEIFSKHYGSDWKTPKKSNFIDFESYDFIQGHSYNVEGDSLILIDMLEGRGLI